MLAEKGGTRTSRRPRKMATAMKEGNLQQPHSQVDVRSESAAILDELRIECWSEVVDLNALACRFAESHPNDPQVRKVARLSRQHLQPLIGRLQRPAGAVSAAELAWLRRARRVLPPFVAEFRATVHELRGKAGAAAAA